MKLKDVATVQTGYSFRTRLDNTSTGNVAVIQMKDLQDETVSCAHLSQVHIPSLKVHHLLQKDDLIFRSRGLVNTCAILLENPGCAVLAAPLLRIRIKTPDKILPEYLNWYIRQKDAQIFLNRIAKGTVQQMIAVSNMEDLPIALPSVDHQKKIIELATLVSAEKKLLYTLASKREQYISTRLMQLYCATP